ncbi:MAG TPA: multiubiquitin domain-containing protein [Candidatus Obscuribacterales bacterium]
MNEHNVEVFDSSGPVCEEPEVDFVIDLEEFARDRRRPPLSKKGYRIKINGDPYIILSPTITGRQVLEIAGLLPPENYTLRVKISGERPRKVDLDEVVDLREPGVEKFKALPRDQTEG